MRAPGGEVGFVICDAVTGAEPGNIALGHDGRVGEVPYRLTTGTREGIEAKGTV
ncbi:hypothetical protein [Streptosporangium sandarakinum]